MKVRPFVGVVISALLAAAAAPGAEAEKRPRLPVVSVRTLQGEAWNISDQRGRVSVLHFWSLNCRPCLAVLPRLRRLYSGWKKRSDVALVGLPTDDDLIQIRRHVERQRMSWTQLVAESGSALPVLAGPLGIKEMPTPFFWIVDPDGKIVATATDPETAKRLAEQLALRERSTPPE